MPKVKSPVLVELDRLVTEADKELRQLQAARRRLAGESRMEAKLREKRMGRSVGGSIA